MWDSLKQWWSGKGNENVPDQWDDDEEYGDGDEEQAEEQAPELDEAQTAYLEQQVKERVAQAQAQMRQGLQSAGLDWTDQGPVVRNAEQVARQFGLTPAAKPPEPEPEKPAALPDEAPDPYDDPKGYQQYLIAVAEQRAEARYAERLRALDEQGKSLAQMVVAREANDAVTRAKESLRGTPLEIYTQHPDFDQQYREIIAQIDPSAWGNQDVIDAAVGSLWRKLDPAKMKQQPRDEGGRFRSPGAQRADLQRSSLAATGASRATGGAAHGEYDEFTREMARCLGVPPGKARALDSPSIADWEKYEAEQQARRQARR